MEKIHKFFERKCNFIVHKQFNHKDTFLDNILLRIYSKIEWKLRKILYK